MEANGRLYFAAPNGLIFGSGAIIQAAQLHAIAGGLSNDDFIQGIERYSHLSGELDNQSISANDVVLGGRSVTNSGTITMTEGTTVLAAGGSMEVFATDSILGVEISSHPPCLMFRWGILPDRRFCSREFWRHRVPFYQETGSNSRVPSQHRKFPFSIF